MKVCVSCSIQFEPGSEGEDECMACYYEGPPDHRVELAEVALSRWKARMENAPSLMDPANFDLQAGGCGMTPEEVAARYPEVIAAAKRIKRATYATQEKSLRDAGWVLVGTPEKGEWVPPPLADGILLEVPPDHPLAHTGPFDNRGPKVCEVCGEYEGALLSVGATWICADVEACRQRTRPAPKLDSLNQSLMKAAYKTADQFLEAAIIGPTREHTCRLCGLTGDLARSQYGWVHEACLMADDSESDYEALGYPETDVTELAAINSNIVAAYVYFWAGGWAATIGWDPMRKDIRDATDNG